jgi:hypothetical protein
MYTVIYTVRQPLEGKTCFITCVFIYNVRKKYGMWSLLVHEISILQYFANLNIGYIHVLYPYLDIVIVNQVPIVGQSMNNKNCV